METIIPMILVLVAAMLVAALPMLQLGQVRAALKAAFGSVCFASGCLAFFALCSGLLGNIGGPSVFAADSGAKEAAKDAAQSRAKSDPSPGSTAEAKSAADESTFFEKLPEGQLHTLPKVNPENPEIPAGRPEWVGRNVMVGSQHSLAVSSGLYVSEAKADLELASVIKAKTDEYIAEQLGSSLAPQLIRFDATTISRELIHLPVYHEEISGSVGPMHQAHALIEFGPEFRQTIVNKWTDLTAYYRLLQTGLVAGGALLFLGTIFSYFRLDNATRGYYTGRLQFMTAAAILAIVGSGALLAKWIYWL